MSLLLELLGDLVAGLGERPMDRWLKRLSAVVVVGVVIGVNVALMVWMNR